MFTYAELEDTPGIQSPLHVVWQDALDLSPETLAGNPAPDASYQHSNCCVPNHPSTSHIVPTNPQPL